MLLQKMNLTKHLPTDSYPFSLPWLANLQSLSFDKPVTMIVGENGSGKSSLMEAIAIQAQAIVLAGETFVNNPEYQAISKLSDTMQLSWSRKSSRGFFFRADDFISFILATQQRKQDAQEALNEIKDPQSLARIPYLHTLYDLSRLYPTDLGQISHGEAFLALFKSRLRDHSLYFLDEPETPLTPQHQLALLYVIHEAVLKDSQFIIVTHSPILMAYPQADILELSETGIRHVAYDQIEHVQFMKHFLDSPERYLSKLFSDDQ